MIVEATQIEERTKMDERQRHQGSSHGGYGQKFTRLWKMIGKTQQSGKKVNRQGG